MVKVTQELREQHELLRESLLHMETLMEEGVEDIRQARRLERLVRELGNHLIIHLGEEDTVLYPKLAESANRKIRSIARSFIEEMGGLARFVETYLAQWSAASAILTKVESFKEDTENLLCALTDRIEREEIVLFPLLDSDKQRPSPFIPVKIDCPIGQGAPL